MIQRLLIANRGEIAVRIVQTCKRLGIRTAAIYSDADQDALHARLADEAFRVGPAEAAKSYLDAEAIVAAAKRFQADAIHPGYGFLSESTALIHACEKAGILFVGPSAEAIRRMGSKIESKRIAEEAGVPVVPGHYGDQDEATLLKAAKQIAFPLLIKASAGGGGKGMRIVEEVTAFPATLAQVRREAKAAFGDDAVLLERLIRRPRHIEVQIVGDKHGNVIHIFERECSIQRRHQKLIEEAPAAFLPDPVRAALFANAVRLAKAIRYDSLGTIEFIYDTDREEAYFLEMNTRLQVEHPTTELVTGLDLVELQLRIAAGEPLSLGQGDVAVSGWAIEARVNAEAPAFNFRPEIGRIALYDEPRGNGVRVDSGIAAGSEVSPWYDPMLAKVIAHGKDREGARRRLHAALDRYAIAGVATNTAFLADVLAHPNFTEKELTTQYLAETFPEGWQPTVSKRDAIMAAIAYVLTLEEAAVDGATCHGSPWHALGSWRLLDRAGHPGVTDILLLRDDVAEQVKIAGRAGHYRIEEEDAVFDVRATRLSGQRFRLWMEGETFEFRAKVEDLHIYVAAEGRNAAFTLESHLAAEAAASAPKGGGYTLYAPMPGLITEIAIKQGEAVKAGDLLIVMEAMKLVHNLVADQSGVVQAIHCQTNATVPHKAPLIEIGPAEEAGV